MATLYERVFLLESKVKHQPEEGPLTHAVFDLRAIRSNPRLKDLIPSAEWHRRHQERRIAALAGHRGGDVHEFYKKQPYQSHAEHAHQVARIMASRSDAVEAHPHDQGVDFSGPGREREAHARSYADQMNRLHGEGTANVSSGRQLGDVHRVGLRLPAHSNDEQRGHRAASEKLLNDAKNRMVKTGGEHIEWRESPRNLAELMFLRSVASGKAEGRPIRDKRTGKQIVFGDYPDPRFKGLRGYHKTFSVMKTARGKRIAIHYWEHPETGHRTGFKFKPQGA